MKSFLICLCLLCSCVPKQKQQEGESTTIPMSMQSSSRFQIYHDDQKNVTCWVHVSNVNTSMSCLPDNVLVE